MPDMIKDGNGSGCLAAVDCENRLNTYSTTETELSHESETNKRAYSVYAHAIPGTVDTGIMTIKNTSSTKNLIIEKMIISSEENTDALAMTAVHAQRNPSTVSGGLTLTPVNLNFSTNQTADATCLEDNDGSNALTVSGGNGIVSTRIMGGGMETVDFHGAIILGVNDTFGIKGYTDNAGKKVRVMVYFYYHEAE